LEKSIKKVLIYFHTYANAYKKKGTPVTEIFQYMFLLIFSNRNMYKRIVSMKRLS